MIALRESDLIVSTQIEQTAIKKAIMVGRLEHHAAYVFHCNVARPCAVKRLHCCQHNGTPWRIYSNTPCSRAYHLPSKKWDPQREYERKGDEKIQRCFIARRGPEGDDRDRKNDEENGTKDRPRPVAAINEIPLPIGRMTTHESIE